MKKLNFLLILIIAYIGCRVAYAEEWSVKYSSRDFTGMSFKDVPVDEFNNLFIRNSCFCQELTAGSEEKPKDIFPDGMIGVTFKDCNLDNVYVPPGNIIIDGTNKWIFTAKDGLHWEKNKTNKKIKKPICELIFDENDWSKDPKDVDKEKKQKTGTTE